MDPDFKKKKRRRKKEKRVDHHFAQLAGTIELF